MHATTPHANPAADGGSRAGLLADLEEAIGQASDLLPAQGPITVFISSAGRCWPSTG